MKPVMRKLEKKLGTRILKYEVWNDPAAYKLMQFLDKNPSGKSQCGGLPFFYNRRTGAVVCGATTEANLENWARGRKHAVVLTPPPSAEQCGAPASPSLFFFFVAIYPTRRIAVSARATGEKARRARLANEKKRAAVDKIRARNPGAAAGLERAPPANPRLPRPLEEEEEA
jgi:hypothetical protein